MFFKYIHDVNAKVEQGRRYLTDHVRIGLDEVDVDGEPAYQVTAHPAVIDGYVKEQSTPVHPKTESVEVDVPTFAVPSELKMLVRAEPEDRKQDSSVDFANNWREEVVAVYPIVDETFEDFKEAVAYYEEVAHQLAQGDDIRNYRRSGGASTPAYDIHNSRYRT